MSFFKKNQEDTTNCGLCGHKLVPAKMPLEFGLPIHGFCCRNCGCFRPFTSKEKKYHFYGDWNFDGIKKTIGKN